MKSLLLAVLLMLAFSSKSFCQKTAAVLDSEESVKAFTIYMIKTARYPQAPRENGTVGEIVVGFSVDENQSISNIKILKRIDAKNDLENEVIRSLKAFQGKLNIKPAEYSCAVAFVLLNGDGEEINPFKVGDKLADKYKNFLGETVVTARYR